MREYLPLTDCAAGVSLCTADGRLQVNIKNGAASFLDRRLQ
ncbi:hypothetical protein HCH_03371 [Hahella chejuensis KCTC 2396]|uniref:Uncharacterized protein n=1 Tax=Hahella chejuensis (strain KCTC 2396) TaxID=349521 RepID=Q2SGV2_HAHCH|nr:hypothetical protein HCH_03371 [Hahella chejuensis KCTC 2396]